MAGFESFIEALTLVRDAKKWLSSDEFKRRKRERVLKKREEMLFPHLSLLHYDGIHPIRDFAVDFVSEHYDEAHSHDLANHLCTCARRTMGELLDLRPDSLHCCLKFLIKGKTPDDDQVCTWGRSEPFDDRPHELGEVEAHLVKENTVWCALLGRRDPGTTWREFKFFACNDLHKYQNSGFHCDRIDWQRYYRSTLVFPLRFWRSSDAESVETVGFLAFDSPRPGVFWGLPDILAFGLGQTPEGWSNYHSSAGGSAVFHAAAIMSDTLSVAMRQYYAGGAPRLGTTI